MKKNIFSCTNNSGTTIINGKVYHGSNICIGDNNVIYSNGKQVGEINERNITVEITGNVEKVDTIGPVTVTGDADSVNTTGRVSVGGTVKGDINTTGRVDVEGNVLGKISTIGSVTVGRGR